MITKLLIATHNYGKYQEIKTVLANLPIEILSLKDLNITEDVEETGSTYEENAIIKARFFCKKSGLPTITDDSGITIQAIQNELGIHTRRWGAGAKATDQEWLDFFLQRMANETNRKAVFFTTIALVENLNTTPQIFVGECAGVIANQIEASYLPGIPLSAVFKPKGLSSVYSALSPAEKNQISHRGKATNQLYNYLITCVKPI